MIESIFGNKSAEKVLLFLYAYGQGYPRNIAKTFNVSLRGIQQQLERLEEGGILVSRLYGRVRIYQFNPKNPFINELKSLLNKAMEFVSREEKEKYYRLRTRPRRKGKKA